MPWYLKLQPSPLETNSRTLFSWCDLERGWHSGLINHGDSWDRVHQESFSTLTFWLKSILNSLVLQPNSSCFQEHTWKSTEFNHCTQLDSQNKNRHDFEAGVVHKCPAGPSFSLTHHLPGNYGRLRTEELLKNLLKRLTFTGHLAPAKVLQKNNQQTQVIIQKNSTSSLTSLALLKGEKKRRGEIWTKKKFKLVKHLGYRITQKANRFFQTVRKKLSLINWNLLTKSNQRTKIKQGLQLYANPGALV